MKVEQLSCNIGAELVDVNLRDAVHDEGLFSEIRNALLKHKVLFLRDQDISRAEHVAFAERFGKLEDHPVAGSHPDHPGLVQIYKTPDSPPDRYENAWHTDATWREAPPLGLRAALRGMPAVSVATRCGQTWRWPTPCSLRISRTRSPTLRARHSIEASFGAAMPIEKRLALKAQYPDAEHPVVRTHPETGEKVLFVNAFTTHFSNFHTQGQRARGPGCQSRRSAAAELPDQPGLYPGIPGALALEEKQRGDLGQPFSTQHYAVMDYPPCHRQDGTRRNRRRQAILIIWPAMPITN